MYGPSTLDKKIHTQKQKSSFQMEAEQADSTQSKIIVSPDGLLVRRRKANGAVQIVQILCLDGSFFCYLTINLFRNIPTHDTCPPRWDANFDGQKCSRT